MTNTKPLIACCGILCMLPAWGQSSAYIPGVTYQSADPHPNKNNRNPFYFEGRIDWNLLKITTPTDAWEFAQRGIYEQDDLENLDAAIADYREAYARNNLANGTCQIITSSASIGQNVNPAPCMFTFRLRLGYLLHETSPLEAISLFQEVLNIDPLRLGVNQLIGDTYQVIAQQADNDDDASAALQSSAAAYNREIELSPVTPLSVELTGDLANNAHTHWALAGVYKALGDAHEACELDLYLKATKWHSDTYPWRIQLAQTRLANLTSCPTQK